MSDNKTDIAINLETPTMTKKVDGMVYKINIYFSEASKEVLKDKLIRMLKVEAAV